MFAHRIRNLFALAALGVAMLGSASADVLPGGTSTKTLEYRTQDVTTIALSREVETYQTTLVGLLAGQSDPVIEILFAAPFGDPVVQSALDLIRSNLSFASGGPLSFSGPSLAGSTRTLLGSSSSSTDLLTAEEVLWVNTFELVGEELFRLNSTAYGCVAEIDGVRFDCARDNGELFVPAGDTVLLTSAGIVERVQRTTVTTSTYLTASRYEIVGTPATVPEPSTGLLVGLAGLLGWLRVRARVGPLRT